MKNKFLIILILVMLLILGFYGKMMIISLCFILSIILAYKKNKNFYFISIIFLLILFYGLLNLKNIEPLKNQHKTNNYEYLICPFISNTCISQDKIGFYDYITVSLKQKGYIPSNIYYLDYSGNIFFKENASKREKYLDNKSLVNISYFYKKIFIPFSKDDLIIYDYSIAKTFKMTEILQKENKCELLLYGAQNGWNEYKENLIKELQKKSNKSCINNLNNILLNDDIDSNKDKFITFLKMK